MPHDNSSWPAVKGGPEGEQSASNARLKWRGQEGVLKGTCYENVTDPRVLVLVQGGIVNSEMLNPQPALVLSYIAFEKEAAAAGFHVSTGWGWGGARGHSKRAGVGPACTLVVTVAPAAGGRPLHVSSIWPTWLSGRALLGLYL